VRAADAQRYALIVSMFNPFKKKAKSEPDASCIVPRIKHTNMLVQMREMDVPPNEVPFTESLVADLLLAYAFDLPGMFRMVKESDLQRLGLTPSALRAIALKNLRSQVAKIKAEGQGTPVVFLTAGKDFGACLLLMDEVWEDLSTKLPDEIVVAVPGRGIVLATSSQWPEGLALMRELTDGALVREHTHALTDRFLVRRQDVWMTFEPSA